VIETAIVVSQFRPDPAGHGGEHRVYQLLYELESKLGSGRVSSITYQDARNPVGGSIRLPRLRRAVLRRLRRYGSNPLRAVLGTVFDTTSWASVAVQHEFLRAAGAARGGCLVLLGHVGFADILPLARKALGQRAVLALAAQNMESLDVAWWPGLPLRGRLSTAIDLVDELSAASRFDRRIAISRVEAGLLSGVGLSAEVHAYRPVGLQQQRLIALRERRARDGGASASIVVLGSASHAPTARAMDAIIRRLAATPPFRPCEIHLAGKGTERWLGSDPAVFAHGWMDDAALDALLTRARVVVAPHSGGFGALTRLPELACAGVPVWAPPHAEWAQDLPPGVVTWNDKSPDLPPLGRGSSEAAFDRWAAAQPEALIQLLNL
jgi:hypothetical protein